MESSRRLAVVDKICREIEFQGLERDDPIVSPGPCSRMEYRRFLSPGLVGFTGLTGFPRPQTVECDSLAPETNLLGPSNRASKIK